VWLSTTVMWLSTTVMWFPMPLMYFPHANHVIIHAGHATFPNASHVLSPVQSYHLTICTRESSNSAYLRDFYQIHSNSSKLSPLGALLTTNFLSTSHSHLSHVVIRSSLAPLHLTSTSVDPACPHYFYHLNK
jgi:hypothetical protein